MGGGCGGGREGRWGEMVVRGETNVHRVRPFRLGDARDQDHETGQDWEDVTARIGRSRCAWVDSDTDGSSRPGGAREKGTGCVHIGRRERCRDEETKARVEIRREQRISWTLGLPRREGSSSERGRRSEWRRGRREEPGVVELDRVLTETQSSSALWSVSASLEVARSSACVG